MTVGRQFDEGWPDDESRAVIDAIRSVAAGPAARSNSERLLNEAGRRWAEAHRSGTLMRARLEALGVFLETEPEPARSDYLAALHLVTDAATWTSLDHLEREALVDPLTGAGNRRALDLALEGASSAALHLGIGLVVVAIDIDGLKRINDESGHQSGDRALVALVDAVTGTVRASDTVFRTGGDEFVLLLQGAGPAETAPLMDRIAGSGAPPFSWGAAALTPQLRRPADLLSAADDDLYRRRRVGRHTRAARPATVDRASLAVTSVAGTGGSVARSAGGPADGGSVAPVRVDMRRRQRPGRTDARRRALVAAAATVVLAGGIAGTVVGLSPHPATRTASSPTIVPGPGGHRGQNRTGGPSGHRGTTGQSGATVPTPTVGAPTGTGAVGGAPSGSRGVMAAGGGRVVNAASDSASGAPSRAAVDTVPPTVPVATAPAGGAASGGPTVSGAPSPAGPPVVPTSPPTTTAPATSSLGAVVSGLVGTVDGVAGTVGQVLTGVLGIVTGSTPAP